MTTKKAVLTAKKSPAKKTPILAKPDISSKPVAKSSVKPAIKTAKKAKKEHKVKVMRDSFTMPQVEYQKIAEIKATCLKAKMHVKKSEVLRAGLKLLAELSTPQLKRVLDSLEKIKTGRPQKHG
ncbi:MAG: hypothetical protein HY938_03695 [Nitrosomonadales bacterium]|nr:hypothetical protein [Nitrosomonadales bacterium]